MATPIPTLMPMPANSASPSAPSPWKLDWARHVKGGVLTAEFLPDGESIVYGTRPGEIVCVDIDGNEKWVRPLDSSSYSMLVHKALRMVFVGTWGGALFALNFEGENLWALSFREEELDVGATKVAAAEDGSRIFVDSAHGAAVIALTAAGEILWRCPTEGRQLLFLACSSDGRVIAATNDEGQLTLINSAGEVLLVRNADATRRALAVSSDGQRYFHSGAIHRTDGAPSVELRLPRPMTNAVFADDGATLHVGGLLYYASFGLAGDLLSERALEGGVRRLRFSQAAQLIGLGSYSPNASFQLLDLRGNQVMERKFRDDVEAIGFGPARDVACVGVSNRNRNNLYLFRKASRT